MWFKGVSFNGQGKAFFRNRYVRTPGFVAERRSGKQLFRSAFNRSLPDSSSGMLELRLPWLKDPFLRVANPLALEVKDTANTNVLHWGGKTLALYERGMPHALTPDLRTIGPDTLGDTVDGKFMAAHLRTIRESDGTDRLVMFSMDTSGLDGALTFYEYGPDFQLLHRSKHTLPGAAFGFFHDVAVTQNFYVLAENPITPDMAKLVTQVPLGQASIAECLEFDAAKPMKLHLIPRPGTGTPPSAKRTINVPGPGVFTFHHVNAFEVQPDGSEPLPLSGQPGRYLVLDSATAARIDFSNNTESVGAGYYGDVTNSNRYWRTVIDMQAAPGSPGAVVRHQVMQRSVEFPIVHPAASGRPHTTTFLAACPVSGDTFFGPLQAVCKVDMDFMNGVGRPFNPAAVATQLWLPSGPAAQYPGKGVKEDDGWLLSMVFDAEAEKSHVVILDAANVAAGPLARLQLPHHVPMGLHGMFTPAYLGPSEDTPNSPPYDIRQGV
ncbi:carotenoid oxygenase [Haematococcus lacustris]|uniref:Carotenoid oxygenase n=1 Tax=Haematococcus lacustris TaxID=44745 RepID=A0A699ZD92_HAELA|nr:carotenoid oxygenase [Haematococcus lacustris]